MLHFFEISTFKVNCDLDLWLEFSLQTCCSVKIICFHMYIRLYGTQTFELFRTQTWRQTDRLWQTHKPTNIYMDFFFFKIFHLIIAVYLYLWLAVVDKTWRKERVRNFEHAPKKFIEMLVGFWSVLVIRNMLELDHSFTFDCCMHAPILRSM